MTDDKIGSRGDRHREGVDLSRSAAQPPAFFYLVWCPECQRDDRLTALRARLPHNTPAGRRCSGKPIRVRYEPVVVNPLREAALLEQQGEAMTPSDKTPRS